MSRKREISATLFGMRFSMSALKYYSYAKMQFYASLFGTRFGISAEKRHSHVGERQGKSKHLTPSELEQLAKLSDRFPPEPFFESNNHFKRGDQLTPTELERLANRLREIVERMNAGDSASLEQKRALGLLAGYVAPGTMKIKLAIATEVHKLKVGDTVDAEVMVTGDGAWILQGVS